MAFNLAVCDSAEINDFANGSVNAPRNVVASGRSRIALPFSRRALVVMIFTAAAADMSCQTFGSLSADFKLSRPVGATCKEKKPTDTQTPCGGRTGTCTEIRRAARMS